MSPLFYKRRVSFTTDEPLTVEIVPNYLKWLSDRQSDRPARLNSDPLIAYRQQLEEVIVGQSAEIEALRQMIQSEHDRHARMPRHRRAGGESGLLHNLWRFFR